MRCQIRSIRILLVAAAAMIAGTSLVFAQASTESEGVNAATVTGGDRYEGYKFMDVDGNPLPFQTDEEIEKYLSTADVEAVSAIPVGVSRPRKVLFSRDGHRVHAVFKNIDERRRNTRDPTATGGGRGRVYLMWRDSYIYDLAAYHVDRLLGLDRVPPIVPRKFRGDKGSFAAKRPSNRRRSLGSINNAQPFTSSTTSSQTATATSATPSSTATGAFGSSTAPAVSAHRRTCFTPTPSPTATAACGRL
jgi:hypothetical protein